MKAFFKTILSLAALVAFICVGLAACGFLRFDSGNSGITSDSNSSSSSSGSGSNSGSSSSGSSSNNGSSSSGSNSGNSSGGNSSSQPKEDSDGTFIYSGASVKAANTSISGDIVIPASHNGTLIDTIPASAFKGCYGITSITVPESITSIGEGAFNGCSLLRSITLPFVGHQRGNNGSSACFGYIFGPGSYQGSKSVSVYNRSISGPQYYYVPSTLRSVTITNETIIDSGAFYDCSMLTEINLNDGILQVGVSSFAGCSKIEKINLPSITIIPSSLFSGCISLSSFTINDSVDTIGSSAFKGCTALSSVNSTKAGEFIIPDSVTSIGEGAFNGCSFVKSITLPFVGYQRGNNGSSACFGYIFGSGSYQGSKSVSVYNRSISGPQYYYVPSALRSVTITNETIIDSGAFYDCSMIETLKINSSASQNVGKDAFKNTATPDWV